ncbi:MAG: uracil-DNA glycosylase [Deltaproteobacteria bacterium]|nr:MAG: uracil-DNA glycosylase [Deltaproteobacteria bacterium]
MAGVNPYCFKCAYLSITFEPGRPYACLAMRFKSRKIPSRVVFDSSGLPCQLFSPKSLPGKSSGGGKKSKWVA